MFVEEEGHLKEGLHNIFFVYLILLFYSTLWKQYWHFNLVWRHIPTNAVTNLPPLFPDPKSPGGKQEILVCGWKGNRDCEAFRAGDHSTTRPDPLRSPCCREPHIPRKQGEVKPEGISCLWGPGGEFHVVYPQGWLRGLARGIFCFVCYCLDLYIFSVIIVFFLLWHTDIHTLSCKYLMY